MCRKQFTNLTCHDSNKRHCIIRSYFDIWAWSDRWHRGFWFTWWQWSRMLTWSINLSNGEAKHSTKTLLKDWPWINSKWTLSFWKFFISWIEQRYVPLKNNYLMAANNLFRFLTMPLRKWDRGIKYSQNIKILVILHVLRYQTRPIA